VKAAGIKIALVGNPNSGKSTLFNDLTGLRQKTGNYPGVTVDVREADLTLDGLSQPIKLIDLPGAYSLYPTSTDEKVVVSTLTDKQNAYYPDAVIYVASAMHLEKHFLLCTQIMDLGIPTALVINMADEAKNQGMLISTKKIEEAFRMPVIMISARTGENKKALLDLFQSFDKSTFDKSKKSKPIYHFSTAEQQIIQAVKFNVDPESSDYAALLKIHHSEWLPNLSQDQRDQLQLIKKHHQLVPLHMQVEETLDRYEIFTPIVRDAVQMKQTAPTGVTDRLDMLLTHRVAGPMIFLGVMYLLFTAIFAWSELPMQWIERAFVWAGNFTKYLFGQGMLSSFLADGLIAGLSGVLVFVPQIAILFFLISLLEEVGYMSRAVFLFDKLLSRFGMNGRSVVALISGGACAVPAIMSCRTIGNWKERVITVMVTPFISCSARLPVYATLIAVAIPNHALFGMFSLKAFVFFSLYLLGVVAALGSGWLLKKILKTKERSYLAIELPEYRMPHWKNIWLTLKEKVGAFIFGAGKIILIISMVLWALSSFGPSGKLDLAQQQSLITAANQNLNESATADLVASSQLEASWAGYLGRLIEPAIKPLGYDWKIGIAIITSFAAREVFVGTMATIYSIGSQSDDDQLLRDKMSHATFSDGSKVYSLATGLSLLVFYALAMQCMSTLAVTKKELGSWKWALLQFLFMSILAYVLAWFVYQVVVGM
jgi:ferrous iron transport protein B